MDVDPNITWKGGISSDHFVKEVKFVCLLKVYIIYIIRPFK